MGQSGNSRKPSGHQADADDDQIRLPEALHQRPDRAALNEDDQNADIGEDAAGDGDAVMESGSAASR